MMNMNSLKPVAKEQVDPMAKLKAPRKKKMAMPESKETPKMEAQNHSPSFLKKAAKMSGDKC